MYIKQVKEWNTPAGMLKLERFPFKGDKSHRAWDAADEWITSKINIEPSTRILVTGEGFGVLSTAWGGSGITALNDSLLAVSAAEHNRALNIQHCRGDFTAVRSTDALPEQQEKPADIIVIKLPKNLELLEIYIRLSLSWAAPGTEIWLGGMEKRWNRGVKKLTDRYLAAGEVFPFERHARWIKFSPEAGIQPAGKPAEKPACRPWTLEKYPIRIIPSAAVFSSAGLDQGTAAFLERFPEKEAAQAEKIADIGCGSGILGLSAASLNPEAEIIMTDESFLAVEAAAHNAGLNGFSERCSVYASNGLGGVENESLDLILCNPPFHYRNVQSREPAAFMFSEAQRCLRPGGTIQVVGNTHLGYHKLLKEYFPNPVTVLRNSKFTVIKAVKQRPLDLFTL